MNYLDFVDSPDIREHLEEIGYRLNAVEAGYLVNHSRLKSLEEKIAAWESILEEMPDESIHIRRSGYVKASFHEKLREYITFQKHIRGLFLSADGQIVTFSPHYYDMGYCESKQYFRTVQDCLERCKKELQENESDSFQVIRVEKHRFGGTADDIHYDAAWLTPGGEITVIGLSGYVDDLEIEDLFDNLWLNIPTPFHRGDILRLPDGRPVVLDSMKNWNSKRMKEEGVPSDESHDRFVDKWIENQLAYGDDSDMNIMGFAISRRGPFIESDFGWWPNYLDLEYYRKPLEGMEKLLALISDFMKTVGSTYDLLLNGAMVLAMQDAENRVAEGMGVYLSKYRNYLGVKAWYGTDTAIAMSEKEYIESQDRLPYHCLHFTDPGAEPLTEDDDRHMTVFLPDISDEDLSDLGLAEDDFFPEADEAARFIYRAWERNEKIVCQCEYGESRSAGAAAAIEEHFNHNGLHIFADPRYVPNKLVYRKLLSALERERGRRVSRGEFL